MPLRLLHPSGCTRLVALGALGYTPPPETAGPARGAGVVKLVDTPDLGSGGASRGGSSPSARTSRRVREAFRPARISQRKRHAEPMQVTETLSEGLKRAFTVVVPAADIESRRTKRLTDLGKTLRLPGFRPGKVPLGVVRQRYGTAVDAEVLEESVNEATRQVLTDRGLRPAMQPKVDVVSGAAPGAADLEFKVELELLPEVPVPDLKAITLTRQKAEVNQEAVDRAMADLARRNRTLEPLEDRASEPGDVLTVDYEGKVEGAPIQRSEERRVGKECEDKCSSTG
jgi:hypothetical protein